MGNVEIVANPKDKFEMSLVLLDKKLVRARLWMELSFSAMVFSFFCCTTLTCLFIIEPQVLFLFFTSFFLSASFSLSTCWMASYNGQPFPFISNLIHAANSVIFPSYFFILLLYCGWTIYFHEIQGKSRPRSEAFQLFTFFLLLASFLVPLL